MISCLLIFNDIEWKQNNKKRNIKINTKMWSDSRKLSWETEPDYLKLCIARDSNYQTALSVKSRFIKCLLANGEDASKRLCMPSLSSLSSIADREFVLSIASLSFFPASSLNLLIFSTWESKVSCIFRIRSSANGFKMVRVVGTAAVVVAAVVVVVVVGLSVVFVGSLVTASVFGTSTAAPTKFSAFVSLLFVFRSMLLDSGSLSCEFVAWGFFSVFSVCTCFCPLDLDDKVGSG